MQTQQQRDRIRERVLLGVAVVLAAGVVWLDIATPFWQEKVILAGFAGAAISFLFSVFVVNRVVARQNARRWAPMIRLALTEFLHTLADNELSEVSRGYLVPRQLTPLREASPQAVHELRLRVVREREQLAAALSSWAEILASAGGNDTLLVYVADVAVHLDEVRDASLELERGVGDTTLAAVNREITAYNAKFSAVVTELQQQLERTPRVVCELP